MGWGWGVLGESPTGLERRTVSGAAQAEDQARVRPPGEGGPRVWGLSEPNPLPVRWCFPGRPLLRRGSVRPQQVPPLPLKGSRGLGCPLLPPSLLPWEEPVAGHRRCSHGFRSHPAAPGGLPVPGSVRATAGPGGGGGVGSAGAQGSERGRRWLLGCTEGGQRAPCARRCPGRPLGLRPERAASSSPQAPAWRSSAASGVRGSSGWAGPAGASETPRWPPTRPGRFTLGSVSPVDTLACKRACRVRGGP